MEFPNLGKHCQYENCNQNDFLPLQCKCGKVFCRVHYNEHIFSGLCEVASKPLEFQLKSDDQIFRCSSDGCRKGDLNEMLCSKCNRHYCIEHRFHSSCPEIDDVTMATKIEQFEAPQQQFREANKGLQEKITENIRQALQVSMKVKTASKIHLMRVKQKALGPKSVSASERVYFAIKKPLDEKPKSIRTVQDIENIKVIESVTLDPDLRDSIPVFVCNKWSLGRVIDSICDTCNIRNENNKISDTKLRLFRHLDGYCISPSRMDVQISELIGEEILVEGDKLVMEYISSDIINNLNEHSNIFLS